MEGTVAGYLDLMNCLLASILFMATDAPLAKYPQAQMWAYAGLVLICYIATAWVPAMEVPYEEPNPNPNPNPKPNWRCRMRSQIIHPWSMHHLEL